MPFYVSESKGYAKGRDAFWVSSGEDERDSSGILWMAIVGEANGHFVVGEYRIATRALREILAVSHSAEEATQMAYELAIKEAQNLAHNSRAKVVDLTTRGKESTLVSKADGRKA